MIFFPFGQSINNWQSQTRNHGRQRHGVSARRACRTRDPADSSPSRFPPVGGASHQASSAAWMPALFSASSSPSTHGFVSLFLSSCWFFTRADRSPGSRRPPVNSLASPALF
uniref:Uncharacterized protein n=1 Tax=Setaria viridis TaxID=4556 RepID=A0A4U6U2H2_SETVI|nr:hypothetical protein SEVIR_6G119450v2 [Setaria viridis]